jgi:hypothetical protein
MRKRARVVPFGDDRIPILAPEHLVVAKVVFNRPEDWLDLEQVLVATPALDFDEIARWLVQLGRDLGLKTLAEGVEYIGQIDYLRGKQVNEVQGFLLARPLDPAALEKQFLNPSQGRDTGPNPVGTIG